MFIRTRVIKGRTYRTLEERYRQGGKVKSRHVRSLGPNEFNRFVDGYEGEARDMLQGYEQLQAREAAKNSAQAPANEEGTDAKDGDQGKASGSASK